MANEFDYEGIEFPVSKRDLNKIEKKNNICINVFYYKNNLFYPVYLSDQNFDDCINLLMITDEVKNKQTNKQTKKQFFKHCLQCFSSERVLVEHRETCLKINDEQTVNLKMVQLNLKLISNNQLCHLRFMLILNLFWKKLKVMIEIIILHTLKNIQNTFLAVLPMKLSALMINLAS